MNTTEHLEAIKSLCRRIIELGGKRTQGKWSAATETVWTDEMRICEGTNYFDAAFIASCAGPAEAMARATIAAIDGLFLIATSGQEPERGSAKFDLNKILAAFPVEMLNDQTLPTEGAAKTL